MKRLSTTFAPVLSKLRRLDSTRVCLLGMLTAVACASSGSTIPAGTGVGETTEARPALARASTTATLAGGRCQSGRCACRPRGENSAEASPPDAGHKRFEIRLGALGGTASLDAPTIGRFDAGESPACFYVDVPAGSTHPVTLLAKEGRPDWGVGPVLEITEYGPKGPYWYDILNVRCDGPGGKCSRDAAEAWVASLQGRKRGRLDPCGSAVITGLKWSTSGGAADRDGGLFRDFTVTFAMDVKAFATQFAPGSTECVPK